VGMVLVVGTASLIHDHHALAVVLVPTIAVLVLIASAIWGGEGAPKRGRGRDSPTSRSCFVTDVPVGPTHA